MEMYTSPLEIAGGLEFMERYSRGLRWLVGMFTHWHWTPSPAAASWRFFALHRAGSLEAVICHQTWSGWWGLVCATADAALEAYTQLRRLGSLQHLEGDLDQLEAILAANPSLRRRVVRQERSLVLRRSTADVRGRHVAGFRRAAPRDLPRLQAYHAACPGPGRSPSPQELARQIDHGAVYVLEVAGMVAAIGKAMPAGSYHYIRDVYTFPEFRRRGCARQLMEGILGVLADARRDACLCVAEGNAVGLELYRPLGFEEWGRRLHLVIRAGSARHLTGS